MKYCPYCAEVIQDNSSRCCYCGSSLNPASLITGIQHNNSNNVIIIIIAISTSFIFVMLLVLLAIINANDKDIQSSGNRSTEQKLNVNLPTYVDPVLKKAYEEGKCCAKSSDDATDAKLNALTVGLEHYNNCDGEFEAFMKGYNDNK